MLNASLCPRPDDPVAWTFRRGLRDTVRRPSLRYFLSLLPHTCSMCPHPGAEEADLERRVTNLQTHACDTLLRTHTDPQMATQTHPPHTVIGAYLVTGTDMYMHRYGNTWGDKCSAEPRDTQACMSTCTHTHAHPHVHRALCKCTQKEPPSSSHSPKLGGDSPAHTPTSLPRTAWLSPLLCHPLGAPHSKLLH